MIKKKELIGKLHKFFQKLRKNGNALSIDKIMDSLTATELDLLNQVTKLNHNILDKKDLVRSSGVRLIAFYLPQFHCIPQNDTWWGKGFTEWTNVQKAQPQFQRHDQPRVPLNSDYYNLEDKNVQRRQIELAKKHGIGGFCFYFYWFGGTRLLELPVKNYLNDPTLKHPFCLCWANENWTRRWDGLDQEILIKQAHSKGDDIDFISYVSQYFKDPRYIRVEGKPLLLVYRPSLLPSAKATADRWREWCIDNGVGEIYLAYTQSFQAVDPIDYGYNAAIEFPPNRSQPQNLTRLTEGKAKAFSGKIYDWRSFVDRSSEYKTPAYKLIRAVNTGWDNTARRKSKATIFVNNTPEFYAVWLYRAIIRSWEEQKAGEEDPIVFINAWNEWAEGAYLEPDQTHGYAFLQATRRALMLAEKNR